MAVETNPTVVSESATGNETPEKSSTTTPSTSPTISRYGRTRKPNLSADFVAHGKNIKNFLLSATSPNGEVPKPQKRRSYIRKKPDAELGGISNPSDTSNFPATSTNIVNGNIETSPATTCATAINVNIKKRGRKKKIPTSDTNEATSDLMPSGMPSENLVVNVVDCNLNSGEKKRVVKLGRPRKSSTPQVGVGMSNTSPKVIVGDFITKPSTSTSTPNPPIANADSIIETPSGANGLPSSLTPSSLTGSPKSRTPASGATPGSELLGSCDTVWSVGDLAWGSIGKHPYWPCIIMTDPVSEKHFMEKGVSKAMVKHYFVQFCGDNGRHSWLSARSLLEFVSKQQFYDLQGKVFKDPRKKILFASKFTIKPPSKEAWERALVEAEHLVTLTRDGRVQHFQQQYPIVAKKTKVDVVQPLFPEQEPKEETEASQPIAATSAPSLDKNEQDPIVSAASVENTSPEKMTIVKNNGMFKVKFKKGKKLSKSLKDLLLPNKKLTLLKMKKKRRLQIENKEKLKRVYKKRKIVENLDAAKSNDEIGTSPEISKPEVNEGAETTSKVKQVNGGTESTSKVKQVTGGADSTSKVKKLKNPTKKPRKRRNPKFGPDFEAYHSKMFERLVPEHPEMTHSEIDEYLRKVWLKMDKSLKLRYMPFMGRKVSSDEEEESRAQSEASEGENDPCASDSGSTGSRTRETSPPPIVEAVSKMKKNLSLFRGFKNERVCTVCEKAGETFKCQGFCFGFFHKDCISKGNPDSKPQESDAPTPITKVENSRKSVTEAPAQDNSLSRKEDAKANGEVSAKNKNIEKDDVGSDFQCRNCLMKKVPPCFECGLDVQPKTNEKDRIKCRTSKCGRFFHESCLTGWPQAILTDGTKRKDSVTGQVQDKVLTCPQHVCHTCVSDNPAVIKERALHEKQLVKCIKCPTTYHFGNYCVPAGSEILSNVQIICPRHYDPPRGKNHHVNANWCFICSTGGDLICCDLCPTTFHAQCIKLTPEEYADGFLCEDCKTGRFPLFGEIVWVKLGNYRWWPAQILFPYEIPDRIMNASHSRGEFAVKFFRSGDYYWVSRGRAFLYQEGDSAGKCFNLKTHMNNKYREAVEEAAGAHKKWIAAKMQRDEESRQEMKPPQYVKIKVNKPIGSIKGVELNVSGLTGCECDPKKENPCSQDDECLNRMLMVECNPLVCGASDRCNNQRFEKRLYPPLEPFRTDKRGWGLRTLVDVKKGDFIIEYVGEIIDGEEFKRRVERMKRNNDENFYFLTLDQSRMIDAGPKGNVARFMNHSCDPNCETQKWTVNGDTRVGLFAVKDIPRNAELVFNYNLDTGTAEKKACLCGAANCRGFIGAKKVDKVPTEAGSTQGVRKKKRKGKENKKRQRQTVVVGEDDFCFICDEGGELIVCNNKKCPRAYHLQCVGKKNFPKGQWLCPWHLCDVCGKRKVFRCSLCVSSFCMDHRGGNIKLDPDRGLCCKKHWQGENVVAEENLSQSIVLEDGAQVLISTPNKEKTSESTLNNDLGTPIRSDSTADDVKVEAQRNLNFNGDEPSQVKRRRLDSSEKVLMGKSNSNKHVASKLSRKRGRALPNVSTEPPESEFCFSPMKNLPSVSFDKAFSTRNNQGTPRESIGPQGAFKTSQVTNASLESTSSQANQSAGTKIAQSDSFKSTEDSPQSFVGNKRPSNKTIKVKVFISPQNPPMKGRQPRRSRTNVKEGLPNPSVNSPKRTYVKVAVKDFDSQSSSDDMASPARKMNKRLRKDDLSVTEIKHVIGTMTPDSSRICEASGSAKAHASSNDVSQPIKLERYDFSSEIDNSQNNLEASNYDNLKVSGFKREPADLDLEITYGCSSNVDSHHDGLKVTIESSQMVSSDGQDSVDRNTRSRKSSFDSTSEAGVCFMIKGDVESSSFQNNFATFVLRDKIEAPRFTHKLPAPADECDSDSDSSSGKKISTVCGKPDLISSQSKSSEDTSSLVDQLPKASCNNDTCPSEKPSAVSLAPENMQVQKEFSEKDTVDESSKGLSPQDSDPKTDPNKTAESVCEFKSATAMTDSQSDATEVAKTFKRIVAKLKGDVENGGVKVTKLKRSQSDSSLRNTAKPESAEKEKLSTSLCEATEYHSNLAQNEAQSGSGNLFSSSFQLSFISFLSDLNSSKDNTDTKEIDKPETVARKSERTTRGRKRSPSGVVPADDSILNKNSVNGKFKQKKDSVGSEVVPISTTTESKRLSDSKQLSGDNTSTAPKRKRQSSLGEFFALPEGKRTRR